MTDGPRAAGTLFVVATPIGNLGDMTDRARSVLASVDVVACEDTRRLRRLATHFGIAMPSCVVVDEHREDAVVDRLVARLLDGESVALTTDAGTPLVSDPGYRLVAGAADAGIEVCAVPGASAVLAALVVSGLPTDRFAVDGFLPRRGAGRQRRLDDLSTESRTTVIFESPRRLAATLDELADRLGDRPVAVCRELTKTFEETWRGGLIDAAAYWSNQQVRGELVIVIGGAVPADVSDDDVLAALERALTSGARRREAIDAVVAQLGVGRNRVYALATGASHPDPDGGATVAHRE